MTFDYILRHDSDTPHCSNLSAERRVEHIEYVQQYEGYSEPGYSADRRGVLLGNWNECSRRAYDLLEKAGYSCEWEDEWLSCEGCGKLFRSTGDSYGWKMYGVVDDGGCICGNCIKSDPSDYLENLEDDPSRAITIDGIDLSEHGYTRMDGEFENGFHAGQTDNPQEILQSLHSAGHEGIVFEIVGVGQFDIRFVAWARVVAGTDANSDSEVL